MLARVDRAVPVRVSPLREAAKKFVAPVEDRGRARIVDLDDGSIAARQGRPIIGVGQQLERRAVVLGTTDQPRPSPEAGVDGDRVELADAQALIERRRRRGGTRRQRLPLAARGPRRIGHDIGGDEPGDASVVDLQQVVVDVERHVPGIRVGGRASRPFDDPGGGSGVRIVVPDDLDPLIRCRIAAEDPPNGLDPGREMVEKETVARGDTRLRVASDVHRVAVGTVRHEGDMGSTGAADLTTRVHRVGPGYDLPRLDYVVAVVSPESIVR